MNQNRALKNKILCETCNKENKENLCETNTFYNSNSYEQSHKVYWPMAKVWNL